MKYDTLNIVIISTINKEEKNILNEENIPKLVIEEHQSYRAYIYITKYLIMSKIIHILQALPTPQSVYFKKQDKTFLHFICKNKRHEINKELLCKNRENGGLKMINLSEMDMSLKITFLRTILIRNHEWMNFAISFRIDRLATTDIDYHIKLYKNTSNPFGKSVILVTKNGTLN